MPAAAAAAVAIFSSAASAAAAAATAIGTAIGAGIGAIGAEVGILTGSAVLGTTVATGLMDVVFALPGFVLTAALDYAIAPKPPKPNNPGIQVSIKADPQSPVPLVFGHTAVGPTLVYRSTSGDNNRYLSMLGVTSVGPVEDCCINLFADQLLLGFLSSPKSGLATVTQVIDDISSGIDSGTKLFKGKFHFAAQDGASTNVAPPVFAGSIDGDQWVGLDSTSKLSGLASVGFVFDYDTNAFASGVPQSLLIEMKGVRCWDPRADSTYPGGSGSQRWSDPTTWVYSENPFIHGLNYVLGFWQNSKKVAGIGAPMAQVDVGAFVSAANIADANGWTCGGQVATSDDKMAVLATILQAGSGVPVSRGAQISCVINAPKTSVYTITTNDVVGNFELNTTTAARDRKNTIEPSYREPHLWWTSIKGDPVTASTYLTEDQNQPRIQEIDYTLCQSAAQAKQLAAYDLVNAREVLTATAVCGPRLLDVRVGECVTTQIDELGIPNQTWLVVGRSLDPTTLQVTLTLRSETASKHAFALGQTAVAPSTPSLVPGYDRSNPPPPASAGWAIVGTSITSDPDGNPANAVVEPAIVVEGECDDVNAKSVIAEYQLQSGFPNGVALANSAGWVSFGEFPRSTTEIDITGIQSGQPYYAAISYRSKNDAIGQRLVLGPVTTSTLAIPANSVTLTNASVGAQSLQQWADFVSNTSSDAANAAASVANVVTDVDLNAQSLLQSVLRDIQLRADLESLTYLNGQPVTNAVTFVQNSVQQVSNGANATANVVSMIGALNANGSAFILNTDTVFVSPTESFSDHLTAIVAQGQAYTNAAVIADQQAWQSNAAAQANTTTLLSAQVANAQASISNEANARVNADTAIATTIALIGAQNAYGTAFVLDQSKCQVSPGVALSDKLSSLQSGINGANASITSESQTRASNASALAQQITTVSATAGSAYSTANTALSASSNMGAMWGVTLNTNGYVSGVEMLNQGQSKSWFSVYVDNFVIGSPAGNTQPFVYSGGTLTLPAIQVDTVKANTITTSHLVGAAVTNVFTGESDSVTTLSVGSEYTHYTFNYTSTGGTHQLQVYCQIGTTTSAAAGAVVKLYCDGVQVGTGSPYCPGNWGGVGLTFPVAHTPGAGTHTYSITYSATGGSGASQANRTSVVLTELKR